MIKGTPALIARSLEKRTQLLKLLFMNNFDMEPNSREKLLTTFKAAYGRSMKNVRSILAKFCPTLDEARIERVLYVFFPFMFGICPYTAVTRKQKNAMRARGQARRRHGADPDRVGDRQGHTADHRRDRNVAGGGRGEGRERRADRAGNCRA